MASRGSEDIEDKPERMLLMVLREPVVMGVTFSVGFLGRRDRYAQKKCSPYKKIKIAPGAAVHVKHKTNRMRKCIVCKKKFLAKQWNTVICGDECYRIRRLKKLKERKSSHRLFSSIN
jgi:hypothetical protein